MYKYINSKETERISICRSRKSIKLTCSTCIYKMRHNIKCPDLQPAQGGADNIRVSRGQAELIKKD